ncbi:MAG: VOC family protein [Nostoc sp. LLA-1]|nr:VOC family protein [Cyanocohniella sp. LLY]
MITGVNHITLSVRNLEESINFYTNVLDFAYWQNGLKVLIFRLVTFGWH